MKSIGFNTSLFGLIILLYPHCGHIYLNGFGATIVYPLNYNYMLIRLFDNLCKDSLLLNKALLP